MQAYRTPRRPATVLFFTLQFHFERFQSRLQHFLNILFIHLSALIHLWRQLHAHDVTTQTDQGLSAVYFPGTPTSEELQELVDGLQTLQTKKRALEAEHQTFLSGAHHLRLGLSEQTRFFDMLLHLSLQEAGDIRRTFFGG